MKQVRFHEEARLEALEAERYYEQQQAGLGRRFADALEEGLVTIARQPQLYAVVIDQARKCRIRRFPYGLIFEKHSDCVYVLAVMHLHREPGYWKIRQTT